MTYLLLSEGAFAFRPDVLTLSHHHEVFCPPLLLIAGAGVWVQLGPLFNEVFSVGPSRLQNQMHHLICSYCDRGLINSEPQILNNLIPAF